VLAAASVIVNDVNNVLVLVMHYLVLYMTQQVERLKGLPLKLTAYQHMLHSDPDLADRVCLVQVYTTHYTQYTINMCTLHYVV
jgi:trehalose-6-phosphate synthase